MAQRGKPASGLRVIKGGKVAPEATPLVPANDATPDLSLDAVADSTQRGATSRLRLPRRKTKPLPGFENAVSVTLIERFNLSEAMQVALLVSLAVHLFAVVAIRHKVPDPRNFTAPHNAMEVVLVNSKTDRAPDKAQALAQANLDGGGDTDKKLRAKTPLPAVETRSGELEATDANLRVKQLEVEAQQLLTAIRSKLKAVNVELQEVTAGKADPNRQAELMQQSVELARQEAELSQQFQRYQERPKRQFIGARTKEYRFAQYVDLWRQKIERIGNLNYPEAAKQRKLYGQLQVTVAIKANGEVEQVEINRTSGHKVLDDAAKRIVMLAAPFEPFPPNIRRDTDILHITRTWTFTRSDQLLSE